jgi:hypothetical protein
MTEEQPISNYFFPKLQAVKVLAPYHLRTTWSTGEVLEVKVGDNLRKIPALTFILDPEVFARAHIAEGVAALSGLIPSSEQIISTLGRRSRPVKSATRCLVNGCSVTSYRSLLLP